MTSSRSNDEHLSAEQRAEIDRVCDEFEATWQKLKRPRIEEFLDGSDPSLATILFEELARIDMHWRAQASDPDVIRAEYVQSVPGDDQVLDSLLARHGDGSSLIPNQTTLGPFLNLQRIGEGGFGLVYRAWDSRHQREVALKIPRFGNELSPKDLGRFLREAKAAGSLDHPGIARVWDSGTISGVAYIAYQFIEGENLKTRFDEFSKRSPREIAAFIRRLAEAVQFAHEHEIVHRDLKPSNILLTPDGRPMLTDFGLALATGMDATRSLATRVGTIDYMSPEQAAGTSHDVDGRADLWSLGVLMYELLSGKRPFEGPNELEVLRAIQQDEPRRLKSLRSDVPLDLDVLVIRCLQKNPDRRLESCATLVDELGRFNRGEPIQARPVSMIERALRWCGRNKRAVATFGLILLITTFGTWSWSGWFLENRQNENTIQDLQIRLETSNVRRRQMLAELLKQDASGIELQPADVVFVETTFLRTESIEVRRQSAILLARAGHFQVERFPVESRRHALCVEKLQSLFEFDSCSGEIRELLEAAIEGLRVE